MDTDPPATFHRVVVGIRDDEAGCDAIALAKQLVDEHGSVTLVHVEVVSARPAPDSGAHGDAARYRRAVERLTMLAGVCGIAAAVSCVEGPSPRRGLHEFASRVNADLLVVSVSRRDEVAQLLLGDDTREVLEGAPCAVAVAPAGYAPRADGMNAIGVAVDHTRESERALALARALAAEHDAELSALEVARPARAYAGFGDPVEELRQYGRELDLLVVGGHRYGPIEHVLEDSISQQLAEDPTSPLLVLAAA